VSVVRLSLAGHPSAPAPVRSAYTSWTLFRSAVEVPIVGMDGIRAVNMSSDALMRDFFKRLLAAGGTAVDIKWLVDSTAISAADLPIWDDVVYEYAMESFGEVDA